MNYRSPVQRCNQRIHRITLATSVELNRNEPFCDARYAIPAIANLPHGAVYNVYRSWNGHLRLVQTRGELELAWLPAPMFMIVARNWFAMIEPAWTAMKTIVRRYAQRDDGKLSIIMVREVSVDIQVTCEFVFEFMKRNGRSYRWS